MRVLVSGAGIGGLTLARALQADHEVTLIDCQPTLSAGGAGLILNPNARDALLAVGVDPRPQAHVFETFSIGDHRGRPLGTVATWPEAGPSYTIHRGALQTLLLNDLQATLRTGTTLSSWRNGVATLSTGETLHADRLVVAEGIGSPTRQRLQPSIRRIYAGYTCWRAVLPAIERTEPIELWGRGMRLGLIPIPDALYVYLVANAPAGTHQQPTDGAALRERFAVFGSEAQTALATLPQHPIMHHDLDALSGHLWHHDGIAFLGDAAHGFTPNMGQGAAMAIEDAVVLAHHLTDLPSYAAHRADRVRWVSQTSQRVGHVGQLSNPLLCWLRDTVASWTPSAVQRAPARRLWLGAPTQTGLATLR